MAASLPIGTKFYEIKGYDKKQYIAVSVNNNYILYKVSGSESIDFK
jgi:hypothetical protein